MSFWGAGSIKEFVAHGLWVDICLFLQLSEILGEHCQGNKPRLSNKVSDFDAFCYASLFHDFIANACSFNAGNL